VGLARNQFSSRLLFRIMQRRIRSWVSRSCERRARHSSWRRTVKTPWSFTILAAHSRWIITLHSLANVHHSRTRTRRQRETIANLQ
jgi:hypothetical protein